MFTARVPIRILFDARLEKQVILYGFRKKRFLWLFSSHSSKLAAFEKTSNLPHFSSSQTDIPFTHGELASNTCLENVEQTATSEPLDFISLFNGDAKPHEEYLNA